MRLKLLLFVFCSASAAAADVYTQKCRAVGDDMLTFSLESTFQEGEDLAWNAVAFEDDHCATPYLRFSRYFKILKLRGRELDLKSVKSTYAVLTDEVARALNLISYCGINNWQVGVETDVTGKKCEDYEQLARDQRFYQIFSTANRQLSWGKLESEYDGLSTKRRPITFEDLPYLGN